VESQARGVKDLGIRNIRIPQKQGSGSEPVRKSQKPKNLFVRGARKRNCFRVEGNPDLSFDRSLICGLTDMPSRLEKRNGTIHNHRGTVQGTGAGGRRRRRD